MGEAANADGAMDCVLEERLLGEGIVGRAAKVLGS